MKQNRLGGSAFVFTLLPHFQKHFLYLPCPSGHYILMKVFSLLSLGEIWEISTVSRIGNSFITLFGVHRASCGVSIRVWGIVYLIRASQSLSQMNEKCSTLSFIIDWGGAPGAIKVSGMNSRLDQLNNQELLFFYKKVILYYERVVAPSPHGYRITDNRIQQFLNSKGIYFRQVKGGELSCPKLYKENSEYFIVFKQSSENGQVLSQIPCMLKHLRNCFAHGHYCKIVLDGVPCYCMEDIRNGKAHTMYAQIPVNMFHELITIAHSLKDNK